MYIKLVKDTITNGEIDDLCKWLSTYPKLTKGPLTEEFEQKWSEWQGTKYSVFLNSGSSANLAMLYALKISNRLKNNKIILPCVSWVTTISPAIQFGMEPILCDTDIETLGLDIDCLEKLCKENTPACIMLVHVLGIPNKLKEIKDICKKYDVILLEDSCESVGSIVDNKKTGTFGLMSSFSTYYGHHFSTIEGGFVCTDDFELYEILKSIRSHGWSRDLSEETKKNLQINHDIDDFKNLYTFYYPGFNLRATDLQAFIGLEQLKKLDLIVKNRNLNYQKYHDGIKNNEWKINPPKDSFISNFSYPVITKNIKELVEKLTENNIECRPLICGSINEHPFWYERYGKQDLPISKKVHEYGLYLPNNHQMTVEEIDKVINIVNQYV